MDSKKEAAYQAIGCILGALSGLFFTLDNTSGKLINNVIHASVTTLCGTCLVSIYTGIMTIRKKSSFRNYSIKDYLKLSAMGIVNMTTTALILKAVVWIDLVDAITIMSSSPVFVVLINVVWLRIKPSIPEVCQVLACVLGCVLCVQPSFIFGPVKPFTITSLIGYGIAVVMAVEIAVFNIFVKQNNHIDKDITFFVIYTIGIPFFIAYIGIFVDLKLPETYDPIWYFLGSCFSKLFGTLSLSAALCFGSSVSVVIGRSFEIVAGFICNVLLFAVTPNWVAVVGGIMVMVAIVLPSVVKLLQLHLKRNTEYQPV